MRLPLRALASVLCVLVAATGVRCGGAKGGPESRTRVIVLGFDGMDYDLVKRLISEGRTPNFARLAASGGLAPLGTALPPQSPVAWSDFITGMDAGGHGIFDFMHRDPKTMLPYLSTSRAVGSEKNLKIGAWQFPLTGGKVELLRHGQPFWEVLHRRGIDTTIIRMPANFPPSGSAGRELSGMGTPDLLGGYGTFSFYTSAASAFAGRDISGGHVYAANPEGGVVRGKLRGPNNPFLLKRTKLEAEFTAYVDPLEPAAMLALGDEERVLRVGEWSDWVPFEFTMIPTQHLKAMARFYLKSVRPEFELYVSPLNIDPETPALPITSPASYARELALDRGRFYTQGMPEDTKALSAGVFTRQEFIAQAHMAGAEVIEQYRDVLGRFRTGLLFYYFGNLDQVSHMMWRPMDPGHPAYDPAVDAPFRNTIEKIYEELDGVVGYTLDRMGDGTMLIVMSDHGFTSWRRSFHLNAWLRDNGYLAVKNPYLRKDMGLFTNVDWLGTRAYGVGLNGLYINLAGRERSGIVPPGERQALMEEIARRLEETIDPKTGQPAVNRAFKREEAYKDRGEIEIGPDLVVGYAKGTRCSNGSALGEVGTEVFTDNRDAWSGDHCMDPATVPGILMTNRPLRRPAPALKDLGAAVLAEFGIDGFPSRD